MAQEVSSRESGEQKRLPAIVMSYHRDHKDSEGKFRFYRIALWDTRTAGLYTGVMQMPGKDGAPVEYDAFARPAYNADGSPVAKKDGTAVKAGAPLRLDFTYKDEKGEHKIRVKVFPVVTENAVFGAARFYEVKKQGDKWVDSEITPKKGVGEDGKVIREPLIFNVHEGHRLVGLPAPSRKAQPSAQVEQSAEDGPLPF